MSTGGLVILDGTAMPYARQNRLLPVLVFLFFNCFYLLTSTGRVRTPDEYMTLFETESMVLRHSTAVPQALQAGNFYGKFGRGGQPHTPYPPGQALAATPWYALGHYVLARLPGVPADAADLIVGFAVCLSSATFSAGAVAFAFLIFCGLGVAVRPAMMATAVIGFATPIFSYSAWFYSEPLATLLLLAAAFFLFVQNAESPDRLRPAVIGGLLTGAAILVRPTHGLAVVVFFAAMLGQSGGELTKPVILAVGGMALGAALLLGYNAWIFGNPLEFGYPLAAEAGRRLNSFETPLARGLFGFLLSPGKSIFLFAPPIVLALAGVPRLWRQNRGLAIAVAATLPAYLFFYARYSQWEGGYCFGPRYLVPALALLCLTLGPEIAEGGRRVLKIGCVLSVLGCAVQVAGIATSFLESQAKGRYYDPHWNYRLSYSLWTQVEIFARYLGSSQPAPLGLGFDRWFVFLSKGGVSGITLACIGTVMISGLMWSAVKLRHAVRNC
ncbi:MAG: hypothetical protein ABSD20_09420 [Terriglobales bacterium]|jgi:hypothetical protein